MGALNKETSEAGQAGARSIGESYEGVVLTRDWRDRAEGVELVFWIASDAGPLRIVLTNQRPVCFVERSAVLGDALRDHAPLARRPLALSTMAGRAVDALYFLRQSDLRAAREQLRTRGVALYESDVKPTDRFLMERFATSSIAVSGRAVHRDGYRELHNPIVRRTQHRPALRAMAIDIETSRSGQRLYSIAGATQDAERVFVIGPPECASGSDLCACANERTLLSAFLAWVREIDPDLLLGWNVVNFDLRLIQSAAARLGVPFALGRGGELARLLPARVPGQRHAARVPGRVVLDGIDTLRAAFWSFASLSLDAVARELLGRGKLLEGSPDKPATIERLFEQDKPALARYNLEDCRLVLDIFAEARLIDFAMRRSELTGLALDRHGGSVAAFDNLYLPRLHRRGHVAPDVGERHSDIASPGGYVMDSQPGLYENVIVLDFKSLYPSIVRTFRVDPLGLATPGENPVAGFLGARFSRGCAILPELISELWGQREQARERGDRAMVQAIKIIMNSFYGVLGSSGCRFHDARLASSITRRGHEIITRSRRRLERDGYRVIYGDTDSIFVLLGPGPTEEEARVCGQRLAAMLNRWWQAVVRDEHDLESFLEVCFETHFARFLMPTVRGAEKGSKKRYAGLVTSAGGGSEVVFKGLESVRTDWTPLARTFQRGLYRRVFLDQPYEEFLRDTVRRLEAGELDAQLVYRKRLRRPLDQYCRQTPPHVQAARKQARTGGWIRYVITRAGPEPEDAIGHALDYDHYREKQLKPVADAILQFLGTSFERVTGAQLAIF